MNENNVLRVLCVLNRMDFGGIEAVVMNYYRNMDKAKIQFDFAVSEASILPQRDEIERLGGHIYLLPSISRFPQYFKTLKKIIKKQNYKIVHCHMNTLSVFPLASAFFAGAKVRICHNHSTACKEEGKRAFVKSVLRPFNKIFATDYFACGEYAAQWMYGEKLYRTGMVHIMPNAIDVERFRYDSFERNKLRKQMNLTDKLVIGHVGRFMHQKNHDFLIDIFAEIQKRKKDAVLLMVGEGELEGKIREKVKKLKLEDNVIFYGVCNDSSKLYQIMDAFVFPSFYEGLGMVTIEAQAAGMPVYVSEAIPKEAKVTKEFYYLTLEESAETWAAKILKSHILENSRQEAWKKLDNTIYSLKREALVQQQYFLNLGNFE